MAIDESGLQSSGGGSAQRVSLSKWVNESLPAFQDLLTAHDVARLTRRHRWVLLALSLIGRFPPMHRYRGRRMGWHRRDVLQWLGADGSSRSCRSANGAAGRRPIQRQLDLKCQSCRRKQAPRPPCSPVPDRHRDRPRWPASQRRLSSTTPQPARAPRRRSTSHSTSKTP